ncbi:hypothetical protein Vadar_011257 [Vaccinium darrowii]|uniref:Uncharacterized protein n=1 Tax=Vaccinium darrowii TaxID=229202 RepID=A0ACB7XPT4_9ERIC|nr:hypothetical protein Vadar_011257 [Vaccinium darrowii]
MFPLDEEAFTKHVAKEDRFNRAIIEKHTAACHEIGSGAKHHFVVVLLTSKEEYGLSEVTIFGLLGDMISAGMDTTTISVEWAMAELIKNPRAQQKAQLELDRVFGYERVMTESDFSNLLKPKKP